MTATEQKSIGELRATFANHRRPEFDQCLDALESFINERDQVQLETARLIFNEAVSARMKSRVVGPMKRRGYLNAAAQMLSNVTQMTDDPELLIAIGKEAGVVADLLKKEFDLERAAAEEQQTRLLMMLQGTWTNPKKTITQEDESASITDESGYALNPES